MKFRLLNANEIDCRIATINEKGITLLLYKDARVDQNILDETVGPLNWQRKHTRDNANCIVEIWDADKGCWVAKEDTGTESFTEKEKGLASDSFKRACFNWGIGRELYSAPFIWIPAAKATITKADKPKCYDRFEVSKIAYDENRNICELEIVNTTKKIVAFQMSKAEEKADEAKTTEIGKLKIADVKVKALRKRMQDEGIDEAKIAKLYKVNSLEDLNESQFRNINDNWQKVKEA